MIRSTDERTGAVGVAPSQRGIRRLDHLDGIRALAWPMWYLWFRNVHESPERVFVGFLGLGLVAVLALSWLFSLVFEKPFLTHRSWRALGSAFRTRILQASLRPPSEGRHGVSES